MFFLFHQTERPFFSTSKKEREEAIDKLISQGTLKNGYYLLLILATCIVVPGLFINNTSVVIGGMIVAPLLIPILSFSLSIVAFNIKVLLRSLLLLLYSALIIIIISAVMSWIMLHEGYYMPIVTQTGPALYVFISFCSGVAGAFGWVKENLSATIAGVATAVSLLPPLAQVGIGLTIKNTDFALYSLKIFGANFVGISLAAYLVFVILGFMETKDMQTKILDENSK